MTREIHRMINRTEYNIWRNMKARCYNRNHPAYKNYGGRGIEVCDEWKNSFTAFYKDMGDRPSLEHTLDRINNGGNYTPQNCAWATWLKQQTNRRNNTMYTFNGLTLTMSQWIRKQELKSSTVHMRIHSYHWPVERALGLGV